METLFSIALAIIAAAAVFYPLLRRRPAEQKLQDKDYYEYLIAKRDELYAAIKDLEFDYMASKLSSEDYQQLREQYESEAILLLQELDKWEAKRAEDLKLPQKKDDDFIESEIRKFKEQKQAKKQFAR